MYGSEILGTTIFMLSALTGHWLVIGATLTALLYIGKGIYNPAIVIMMCLLEKMKWSEGLKNLGCEGLGVIIAIILYKVITY